MFYCEPADQSGSFSYMISHDFGQYPRGYQTDDTHQYSESHLWQTVFFQSAEKLRTYLIANGKQEKQKEHSFHRTIYSDIQLSYQYSDQQNLWHYTNKNTYFDTGSGSQEVVQTFGVCLMT